MHTLYIIFLKSFFLFFLSFVEAGFSRSWGREDLIEILRHGQTNFSVYISMSYQEDTDVSLQHYTFEQIIQFITIRRKLRGRLKRCSLGEFSLLK